MCLLFSGYFDGIVENLSLLKEYYPGWVMRLYYDLDDDDFLSKVIFDCTQNFLYFQFKVISKA